MVNLNRLAEIGSLKKCAEDQYIFKEGDPGKEMYIILNGKVDVFINSYNGYAIKVTDLSTGSFFGEMSLLEDQPRSATVVAVTDTLLLAIDKSNFESFICRQPTMTYSMLKGLSSRIRNLNTQLANCRDFSGKLEPNEALEGEDTKSAFNAVSSILFPAGHKEYSLTAPESHSKYLYEGQATCPVCEKSITVPMQKLSKLKLDKTDDDFRCRYVDFDPLWYSVWLCPHCYYANYYHEFENISGKCVSALQKTTAERLDNFPMLPNGTGDINHVFFKYYAALYSMQVCKTDPLKIGRIWMNLSWLYQDTNDDEMFSFASRQGFESYYHAYYHSNLSISPEQEQQLCLILGELYLRQGDKQEAIRHFLAAIKRNGGDELLNTKAQDRIQSIKGK